jgi:hypothetical protein
MEVSGLLHAPATLLPEERARGAHWIWGWMGLRALLDPVEERKISFPVENRPPAVRPIALRYLGLQILGLWTAPDNEASQQCNIWNRRRNIERHISYDVWSPKSYLQHTRFFVHLFMYICPPRTNLQNVALYFWGLLSNARNIFHVNFESIPYS